MQAYGFDKVSLRLMQSYLIERYQKGKINNSCKAWSFSKYGLILGPILFNRFLCYMFFMVDNVDFASYADDNTLFNAGKKQCEQKVETNYCK